MRPFVFYNSYCFDDIEEMDGAVSDLTSLITGNYVQLLADKAVNILNHSFRYCIIKMTFILDKTVFYDILFLATQFKFSSVLHGYSPDGGFQVFLTQWDAEIACFKAILPC